MSHGTPPYHESSLKAALRSAAANGGLQSFGAGLGSVPRGANFGTAFLAALGGSSKAYSAAQQAAQEYALKQQQAKDAQDMQDYVKAHLAAQTKALEKPAPPPKLEPWQLPPDQQQAAIDFEARKAEALTKAKGQPKDTSFDTFVKEATYKRQHPELFPSDTTDTSWLDNNINTTSTGLKYLDASELQGKEKALANMHAAKLGIPAVGKDTKQALDGIETSRANMADIMDQIGGLLPPDAATRAQAYAGIRLSDIFQTSDQRSAFKSWRTAAIQNLRATAGSKGLRLNQAEIIQAVENDIPRITDTLGAARQKRTNVEKQLGNVERPLLTRNFGTSRTAPASPLANPSTSGTVTKKWHFDSAGNLVPQ